MKKITACILLAILGVVLSVPEAGFAKTKSERTAQRNAKKALKREKKQHKKDLKMQKNATKNWKKHHHSDF